MDAATTLDQTETLALVRKAREGQRDAFAELVRRYQRPVRSFVGRWIRDADAADDVAQDVFIAAYQQLDAFGGTAEFLSWLLGIARHKALTTLRSAARRKNLLQSHLDQLLAQRRFESLERTAVDSEREERLLESLRKCLDGLAPGARELVAAHYYEHRSAESIAAALQRKGNAVRMTLLRIRRTLGDCVRRKLETWEAAP
ncbi:MAG: sigma-70 family RNA polymerase sigma factor [Pirellulales bacterium]